MKRETYTGFNFLVPILKTNRGFSLFHDINFPQLFHELIDEDNKFGIVSFKLTNKMFGLNQNTLKTQLKNPNAIMLKIVIEKYE